MINRSKQVRALSDIQSLDDSLQHVEGKARNPEHLIASGEVKVGNQTFPVVTAIQLKQSSIELSTNVGSLPNTPFGSAVTERLNHMLDGKFVNLDGKQPDEVDVVYTTSIPADGLTTPGLHSLKEKHAKTTALVQPILRAANEFGQPNPQLEYQDIKGVSQDIVDSHLGLDRRQREKFNPVQYLPKS
jgi:hypothetical protein